MKLLGNIFSSCFTAGMPKEIKEPKGKNVSARGGAEGNQRSPAGSSAEHLHARRRHAVPDASRATGGAPAANRGSSAPRSAFKRLIKAMRPHHADNRERTAVHSGGASFDLELKRGRIRVRPLQRAFSSAQARQLEKLLNDENNPAVSLTPSESAGGYTIAYKKAGTQRWVGTAGNGMPVIMLTPHCAADKVAAPPPVGAIAGLSGSPDGAIWRVHHGQLYRWDNGRAEWRREETIGGGRIPVELLGRQLDGQTWARCGSTLLKLDSNGIEGHQMRAATSYTAVRIGPAGEQFALDANGRLCRPDSPETAPRTISLQLSDGRPAFEPIALGDKNKPVMRAGAVDFALAPDGRTLFIRDRAGHLYQADLHDTGASLGDIVARRLPNPMRRSGLREAWHTDALAMAPGERGATALHAVFSSKNGQRVTAIWDGTGWKPQFHIEQPLLLLSDRGLQEPGMRKVIDQGNSASLGISDAGHAYVKEGQRGWQALLQPNGQPVPNLVDLKLGPAGLVDAKPVYARQQDRHGPSRILALEMGGRLARLPARNGGDTAVLPAQQHITAARVLAQTETPMRDFAVDGKGVSYYLSGDRSVVRTAADGKAERLPAPPGLARIEQIAVSGDGNQLFALARGALEHGDPPRMPTLLRYDAAGAAWIPCHVNMSWDAPLHLSTSNLGTLQLTVEKPDGTRQTHRVLPPLGAQKGYELQAIAPDEVSVAQTLTDTVAKRVRVPGTGAFATVTQTRQGVTTWGKGGFKAAAGHAERLLTMPKGALTRLHEQRDGRGDMVGEYQAMRALHVELERMLSASHFPLPAASAADMLVAPAVGGDVAQTCASVREAAMAGMLAGLRRVGMRAGVLGPDLRLSAKAEKLKQAVQARKSDGRDMLPRMIDWLAELEARAQANAIRPRAGGSGASAPVFARGELAQMQQVLGLMHQLREHGVTFPAPDPTLQRDASNDSAILCGAISRHLLTFEKATRLVTVPWQVIDRANAVATHADPAAAANALKDRVARDKVLRLARFGFGGWQEAEAYWEVIAAFRQETAKPRSPLSYKLRASLGVRNARQPADLAVRLAEAMKNLSNRSTMFGIESRGASVGATGAGALSEHAGAYGYITLGIDRATMVGVERTADLLDEGPLVAFFVRQSTKSLTAGGGGGLDFAAIRKLLGLRVQASGQVTTSIMHGKGAAMLVAPEHIDEFCRRLCDPKADPAAILEMGLNEGAIGLDMREKQVTFTASAGGLAGYADQIPAFGPHAGNASHAFQQTGLQRGFAGASVSWTARDFMLKLEHAWEPISGLEYQGGKGFAANAFASLVEQGGFLPHVSDAFALALRSVNVTLLGASVEWSGVESFKRTLDWKTAEPVQPHEWRELAELAKVVFPSQAIGHFHGPHLKQSIIAALTEARTTWGARSEHERATFVNRAEQLLLQDQLAAEGCAMLMPGAKIEFNIPDIGALEKGARNSRAHRSLGPLMESSLRARAAIPGLANAMRAMASLEGTNDARFVFQMDPAFINTVNRLMLEGRLAWEELNVLARTMPAPYRLTEVCAKNSDKNRSAASVNPLPVVAFNDSAEVSRELFAAEAHLRYGLDGRFVGCDLLPSAQRAARNQPLLKPFASDGIHPVLAASRVVSPPVRDVPTLERSRSASPLQGAPAKPFSSRTV